MQLINIVGIEKSLHSSQDYSQNLIVKHLKVHVNVLLIQVLISVAIWYEFSCYYYLEQPTSYIIFKIIDKMVMFLIKMYIFGKIMILQENISLDEIKCSQIQSDP